MLSRPSLRALLLASAVTLASPALAEDPLKVVASFSILGDMVARIGGPDVSVTTLVGPGADAHVFEPSPGDARALGEADLVVVNGLAFESWMPRLVRTAGFRGTMVTASDGVAPREFAEDEHAEAEPAAAEPEEHAEPGSHDHGHDHGHGPSDPHAWQDLRNGALYARNITDTLAEAAPAHAAAIRARGEDYENDLRRLDEEIRARLSEVPAERRRIVTSHDAFGYFGAAYGIEFLAPEGTSTEAAASASDVARVIDQIREDRISAVFVESMTDRRVVDRIAAETGARVGGTLYSDSLSPADGPAPTYEAMFRYNTDQMVAALGVD